MIAALPFELLAEVLGWASLRDHCRLARTCRRLREAAREYSKWTCTECSKRFPTSARPPCVAPHFLPLAAVDPSMRVCGHCAVDRSSCDMAVVDWRWASPTPHHWRLHRDSPSLDRGVLRLPPLLVSRYFRSDDNCLQLCVPAAHPLWEVLQPLANISCKRNYFWRPRLEGWHCAERLWINLVEPVRPNVAFRLCCLRRFPPVLHFCDNRCVEAAIAKGAPLQCVVHLFR